MTSIGLNNPLSTLQHSSSIEISQGMRRELAAFIRGHVENLRKTTISLRIDQARREVRWNERKRGGGQLAHNDDGTFISSVTSPNFHRHNVTPFVPCPFSAPVLVHVEVVALQNRRNGASFKRCSNIVCISCYLSSSLVLPWMGGPLLGPFVIIDPRWCYRGSKWSPTVVYALNEKNGYHVEYIIFVNVFTSSSFSSIKISYNRIFDQSIDNWIFLCTLLT